MLRLRRIIGTALLLAAAVLLPSRDGAAQASQKPPIPSSRKSRQHAQKPAPVVDAPQVPAAPPTLEQQAPSAPQVTYADGQLTIASSNSTLSQVLQSVQAKTGATFDIPSGAGSERVVANLGPGKPQNVLASLLNGSKFNYVILGQANNPGAVQKVILMAKVAGPAGQAPPVTTTQNTFRALPSGQQQPVEPPEDEYQPNEPEAENQVQPMPGQPGGDVASQEVIQPGNRTPEQMLQELQQMQAQQQQMQQQLNPSNQQPFGQPVAPQNQPPGTPFPSQPPVSPQPQ